MTGIVNSTGARSGIIGTTVGTPAASTAATFFAGVGLLTNRGSDNDPFLFPTTRIDREDGATATNFATATGIYTCPKAGYYSLDCSVQGDPGTDTSGAFGMRLFMDGSALLDSTAIGYPNANVHGRSSCNLLTVRLAVVGTTFRAKSYIEGGSYSQLVIMEMLTITYLGT